MERIYFESEDEAKLWCAVYASCTPTPFVEIAPIIADKAVLQFRHRIATDEPVRPNETMQGPKGPVRES